MARNAYVLYLEDGVAKPSLELLRRLVQPYSRSMPHLTVLYSRSEIQDHGTQIYRDFVADEVHLVGPGSFDSQASEANALGTLFIRCESQQLEYLHHKPDFPNSFFHVSLHDGAPSPVAADIYRVLRSFPWNLAVKLPETPLTLLGSASGPRPTGLTPLTVEASALLSKLAPSCATIDDLANLALAQRIAIVQSICEYMHAQLPSRVHDGGGTVRHSARPAEYLQEELWSMFDFMDPSARARLSVHDREFHRENGVFLTPPEISFDMANAAASYLTETERIDFGDPAVGSGIFLASLVNILGADRFSSALGVESDALRAKLTTERWRSVGLDVIVADFVEEMLAPSTDGELVSTNPSELGQVTQDWSRETRSVILANPPYIRSQRIPLATVIRWSKRLSLRRNYAIDRRSDVYVYFVLASHEWMTEGALAVWLLPTEFMFTNYGKALRDYFLREVTLERVHSYDGPSKFSNARVTSCAVIFRNTPPRDDHLIEFSTGGTLGFPYVSTSVVAAELKTVEKWHFVADEGIPAVNRDRREPLISALFKVKRGIATGSNRHFVISTEKADALGALGSEWLKPVVPKARHIAKSILEEGDFDGRDSLGGLWLIDCGEPIEQVEQALPELAGYLRSIEDEVATSTIVAHRSIYYRQESNSPAPFLFSYMARDVAFGKRFFLNRSRAVVLNNYLCLFPNPQVARWLAMDSGNAVRLLEVLRAIQPEVLARHGRVYVEGLTKVEPRELGGVPLIGLPDEVLRLIDQGE